MSFICLLLQPFSLVIPTRHAFHSKPTIGVVLDCKHGKRAQRVFWPEFNAFWTAFFKIIIQLVHSDMCDNLDTCAVKHV